MLRPRSVELCCVVAIALLVCIPGPQVLDEPEQGLLIISLVDAVLLVVLQLMKNSSAENSQPSLGQPKSLKIELVEISAGLCGTM
jgi:hypothetical protein